MSEKKPRLLIDLPDELVGERVIIRPFKPGDGAAVWEAIEESKDHIVPWLPWSNKHQTLDQTEEYVRKASANWLLREDLPAGVWDKARGKFLGGTGFHRIDWEIPSFEIGYWLRKSAEGYGYMSETVRLLIPMAFDILGANRLIVMVATENKRSAAIPRKLGFTLEGTLRNFSRITTGEFVDMLLFAMTPEEYKKLFAQE